MLPLRPAQFNSAWNNPVQALHQILCSEKQQNPIARNCSATSNPRTQQLFPLYSICPTFIVSNLKWKLILTIMLQNGNNGSEQ
jgi:hypothetical protein